MSVIDLPCLSVSKSSCLPYLELYLLLRQHLVCYRSALSRQSLDHCSPFDTSMNFSCAASSGFRSGWYFLDNLYLVSAYPLVWRRVQLTRYAFLISASEASLPTIGQQCTLSRLRLDDPPPRVLYNDSAARHVEARTIASVKKIAEGSIMSAGSTTAVEMRRCYRDRGIAMTQN
jgi:hypothetical protein